MDAAKLDQAQQHLHQRRQQHQQRQYENNNATGALPSSQNTDDKRQARQANTKRARHKRATCKCAPASASGDDHPGNSRDDNAQAGAKLVANKERNDSFNLDRQIKRISLNFTDRNFERQFRSTSDIASCISLVGLPVTLLCASLAHLYLYRV